MGQQTLGQARRKGWILDLRITERGEPARGFVLLTADPAIPTGELCARCGYNDRSNFHKHFLKFTGQSLAEYRSGVREG